MLTVEEAWLVTRTGITRPYCVVCGSTAGIEQHHVVHRSHTVGRKDRGPTLSLCKRCHTEHHSVSPKRFEYVDDAWWCDHKRCTTLEVEPA